MCGVLQGGQLLLVPMAISTWPASIGVCIAGLVRNVPSRLRSARMSAPAVSAAFVSCRVCPASLEPAATDISSRRNSRLPSCITTSRNSTTLGCIAAAAIRWPPIRCGFTTRVAPARSSFASDASVRARAMMMRSGRSARADSVT